jgi:5-methyltetrahydropteroyltriglutamate--homocysteine methyltransferase
VARAEREIFKRLHAQGVTYVQLSEPCLVYQPYRERQAQREELETALDAIRETVDGVPSNFAVQTFFGDASEILPRLLKLPLHTVGFDIFETDYAALNLETSKRLAFGVVDSRDSNVEDPGWIAEAAGRVAKHVSSQDLVFVPNCDLKFVPRQVADAKTTALAAAARLFREGR